jgi:hypothetical protein
MTPAYLRDLRRSDVVLSFEPANGVTDKRSRIAECELFFNVSAVRIDGFRAEMQLVGTKRQAMPFLFPKNVDAFARARL